MGGKLGTGVFCVLVRGLLRFAYGRGSESLGGFKKVWEVWALVYLSLVFREITPYRTQITFLAYPLAVVVFSGFLALWLSSFFSSPSFFVSRLIPSGVSFIGAPFMMVLLSLRRLVRPVVLTMRLTMAAIIMVTVEGIFHYWCVKAGDLHLVSQEERITIL